jgi:hypothetical protein
MVNPYFLMGFVASLYGCQPRDGDMQLASSQEQEPKWLMIHEVV